MLISITHKNIEYQQSFSPHIRLIQLLEYFMLQKLQKLKAQNGIYINIQISYFYLKYDGQYVYKKTETNIIFNIFDCIKGIVVWNII